MEALPYPSPGNAERRVAKPNKRYYRTPLFIGVDSCVNLGLLSRKFHSEVIAVLKVMCHSYGEVFRSTETDDKLVIKCATDPRELMDGPAPFSGQLSWISRVDTEAFPYPSPGNAE
ncbi:hypothetical protein CEXT_300101 [Caerostris extrusa]|uniref:Uncharacterized protein n=1 Tax=Caerostris extrusa TaxID=172846 RepID=A0AAV4NT19_CAEEX|nr:hypothetical protein CEXT_300101 [Caerostris extrusa]